LKPIQNIKRLLSENITGVDIIGKFETISRKCIDTVTNSMNISRLHILCHSIKEQVSLTFEKWQLQQFMRKCADGVAVESGVTRTHSIIRKVEELLSGVDDQEITLLYYRSVTDTAIVTQANRGIKGFIREVKTTVENFDGIEHGACFYRYPTDIVNVESSLFRKLDVIVRIAIQLIAHESFLGRFLRAKSEIILKSCVTRELTIESKIS
jgi:hypothetical protein